MLPSATAGDAGHGSAGDRIVVVGMKMDSHSTELLTWALFKVAQPGDVVLALHVLGNDGINKTITCVSLDETYVHLFECFWCCSWIKIGVSSR